MSDDLVKRVEMLLDDLQGRIDATKLAVIQDAIDRIEELEAEAERMAQEAVAHDMADLIAKQAKVIESLVATIKECGEIGKDGYGSSYIVCHNCVTIYEKTEAALAAIREGEA